MTDRYVKQSSGCILDNTTGLEWESESHGPMPWAEAMQHAAALGDGWRLPTIHELFALVDPARFNPATTLPGMRADWYWSSSSSSCAASAFYAWFVYFSSGYVNYSDKTNTFCVRCVRRGPAKPKGG